MRTLKYREAISEGTVQAMERDPSIFLMGIGVTYPSGIFGTTLEAARRFAPRRVFDVPACENALTAMAVGAAAAGKRPILVHNRVDFMFLSLDALVNLASKWNYMYGGKSGRVPIVVRAIIGKGWGQGATHSQSIQSLLAHFPGLHVLMPASPRDAKGLLLAALRGSAPAVILEHRALYDDEGEVPVDPEPTPIGEARVARAGGDATVVATGYLAREALLAAETLAREEIEIEVIDPRSIRPLDERTILASLEKTGRLVVADTSWKHCGFGSEVAALAAEKGFASLRAPVVRIGVAECPAPVSQPLEKAFYPTAETIARAVRGLLGLEAAQAAIERADTFVGPY